LIEAAIRGWEVAERRTLGTEPLVFSSPERTPPPDADGSKPPPKPTAPLASSLVDAFGERGRKSGGRRAGGESQAKGSLSMFIEVYGYKPVDGYSRADGDSFRTTLHRLPVSYRKSPKERVKALTQIIADADARKAARIGDKTVKRDFWALSQFFVFLAETGQLSAEVDNSGRGFSFNTKGSARKKRDMWSGEELARLFASLIWTGCHAFFRSQVGDKIIRDARFWLPLLGLFHGNRLEEFAQLRRENVGVSDGVPYLRTTDEDGRQLKNEQSRRDVPVHPELIRIGFLDYVADTTTLPHDQVFPDLRPGERIKNSATTSRNSSMTTGTRLVCAVVAWSIIHCGTARQRSSIRPTCPKRGLICSPATVTKVEKAVSAI
jgi:integrase